MNETRRSEVDEHWQRKIDRSESAGCLLMALGAGGIILHVVFGWVAAGVVAIVGVLGGLWSALRADSLKWDAERARLLERYGMDQLEGLTVKDAHLLIRAGALVPLDAPPEQESGG